MNILRTLLKKLRGTPPTTTPADPSKTSDQEEFVHFLATGDGVRRFTGRTPEEAKEKALRASRRR